MKRGAADKIAGILFGIKLNTISDKVVKNTMLKNYLALRKVAKELAEEQTELVEKFNEDWKDSKDEKSNEYRTALKDLDNAIKTMLEREVEVDITPVGMDAFMANVKDESLTFEQIAILSENGILN